MCRHLDVYFGSALSTTTRPVHLVRLSPVGSCEDRARQLFYQLKGGQVDYGKRFAERNLWVKRVPSSVDLLHAHFDNLHRHDRFGVHHVGLFADWSKECPVHMVGHSFGGQTIRVLQQLLHEGAFEGHDTSAGWVRSVTCISSTLNGSLAVYALGAREGQCAAGLVQHVQPQHASESDDGW